MSARDRAVQKTDDDAAGTKASAVHKKYYADPYIEYFVRAPQPRFPLINIGTYCRVKGLDAIISAFLRSTLGQGPRQIVSLGAGSDTRPFHLLAEHTDLVYHEIDFPVKTRKKAHTILTIERLAKIVGASKSEQQGTALSRPSQPSEPRPPVRSPQIRAAGPPASLSHGTGALGPTEIHTPSYHLHGIDLRELHTLDLLPDAPTLVISECCLCYLDPAESAAILQHFARKLPNLALVLYEPIGLGDEFGRVMADNLLQRGLSLPTFQKFNTLAAQRQRITDLGLTHIGARDVLDVYSTGLTAADRQRISQLEFLDEVEEMHMLLRHYCIAWGSTFSLDVSPAA